MAQAAQTKLNEWEVIKEQIERSKIIRVQWKKVFGETLTKKVAGLWAEGKTSKEALEILSQTLKDKGITHELAYKNLKIGVCARYGEIKSEHRTIAQVKARQTSMILLKEIRRRIL